jgi:hypothetical protein
LVLLAAAARWLIVSISRCARGVQSMAQAAVQGWSATSDDASAASARTVRRCMLISQKPEKRAADGFDAALSPQMARRPPQSIIEGRK